MFDVVGLKQRFNVCACMMGVCKYSYESWGGVFSQLLGGKAQSHVACVSPAVLRSAAPDRDLDKRQSLTWLGLFLSYLNSHSLPLVSQDLMVCTKASQRKKLFWFECFFIFSPTNLLAYSFNFCCWNISHTYTNRLLYNICWQEKKNTTVSPGDKMLNM